ncbi:hypothetical protein F7018_15920 [Tenacibaculum aiptasiae]|uniref:Uncharacterized protein n=1 Tax=Tenacibaculum aiptasiae TaxID=426481 RepID=A0A7J5A8S5_9FLAO|nr:hypothetical protein [Tenacibaculum aiptasiae]KAB1153970.1 hypothetical protein F7018_15920 [Tenacibaculum aiptasiae]
MKIDKEKVLDLLKENYTTPREIDKVLDTSKYIFITHKHKDYEADDERGGVFGSGPIVYNKHTKEYYAAWGIDFITGDYSKYLDEISEPESKPSLEKIKEGVYRRNYLNESDIVKFIKLTRKNEIEFELRNVEDYDYDNRKVIVESADAKLLESLKNFLDSIEIECSFVNKKEVLVNQIKS